MTKQRGRGIAAVNYPTGMNLGGDPTQALVHSTPTGNFMVSMSSVDLGQGLKSIMAQICAETLGVPTDRVVVDTADSDTGPHCMGTFASRGTHRAGNAVIAAAKEAREVMMEVAAEMLEVDVADLQTDGAGSVHVVGAPATAVSVTDIALAAHFKQGALHFGARHVPGAALLPGAGDRRHEARHLLRPCLYGGRGRSRYRNRRGRGPVAEERLRDRSRSQSQDGGAAAGRGRLDGHEPRPLRDDRTLLPPAGTIAARTSTSTSCPVWATSPETEIVVLERPAPDGPYGAKGPGRDVRQCAHPGHCQRDLRRCRACASTTMPFTPEKVLARPAGPSTLTPGPWSSAFPRHRVAGGTERPFRREAVTWRTTGLTIAMSSSRCSSAARCCSKGRRGVGKTEAAKTLAQLLGPRSRPPANATRGIDVAHALYEWNYPRQLSEPAGSRRPQDRPLLGHLPDRATPAQGASRAAAPRAAAR